LPIFVVFFLPLDLDLEFRNALFPVSASSLSLAASFKTGAGVPLPTFPNAF